MIELFLSTDGKHTVHASAETPEEIAELTPIAQALYDWYFIARRMTREVALTQHSYRAELWDAATFATHHWAEACCRGVDNAKVAACVSDGAAWIWAIVFMCFAVHIEILDWWHAVQRLWTIANAHFAIECEAAHWVETQKTAFAHSHLRQVMHAVRLLYPMGSQSPEPILC